MYLGTIILIVLSLAPIVFLLWFFDRLDKNKEKRSFLFKIFMWGVFVTVIAGGIEVLLDTFLLDIFYLPIIQLIVSAFIFTALTEEALKYWVVKRKAYPHPAFNEYYDGIIYAVVASLGFAALENVFYVLEGGYYVAVIRSLLAVPAHALFGAFMGYYIGLARFEKNKEKEKKLLFKGLLLAVFFHGLYDVLLMSETGYAIFVIPLVLAMYLNVREKIAHLHKLDNLTGVRLPKEWNWKRYVKVGFGLILFTIGVLTLFTIVLVATGDPTATASLSGLEFNILGSSVFAGIMWLLSFLLIHEKRTKKNLERH
ncbi:PrsW family intramembrane metalloprotease [Patescibacteria group bacterium]